jgi:hypothetical protein
MDDRHVETGAGSARSARMMAIDLEALGDQLAGPKPPREALVRTWRRVSMSTGFMR